MGDIVRFHPRSPLSGGRGISDGHGTSSGQLSENHRITSSYLRAVKVLPEPSTRSKKRQSPAACRAIVARLIDRASAYAEAQAMRLDRSSDSMLHHSRKIPTTQDNSVGKFRLAPSSQKSDKSAMPTVEQIRHTLATAIRKAGEGGAVKVATELGLERNYIRDFLTGKKQSLKTEVTFALAEQYKIPIKDLLLKKLKTVKNTA